MVDTVLQFEGDRHYAYRILSTLKNRFGSTAELGIYEMTGEGMRIVSNPSEILIAQREEQLSGSAIAATLEGMRPLLIEVQALVTQSVYGTPQRTVSGFDLRRLQLAISSTGKTRRFSIWHERCVHKYCRRHKSRRPFYRSCRYLRPAFFL
jgi:DNA repair protein RadA/Sms